jgi:hypothetical protein
MCATGNSLNRCKMTFHKATTQRFLLDVRVVVLWECLRYLLLYKTTDIFKRDLKAAVMERKGNMPT